MADLHRASVARMVPELMPDWPSRWEAATGRATALDSVRLDSSECVGVSPCLLVACRGGADARRPLHLG